MGGFSQKLGLGLLDVESTQNQHRIKTEFTSENDENRVVTH